MYVCRQTVHKSSYSGVCHIDSDIRSLPTDSSWPHPKYYCNGGLIHYHTVTYTTNTLIHRHCWWDIDCCQFLMKDLVSCEYYHNYVQISIYVGEQLLYTLSDYVTKWRGCRWVKRVNIVSKISVWPVKIKERRCYIVCNSMYVLLEEIVYVCILLCEVVCVCVCVLLWMLW